MPHVSKRTLSTRAQRDLDRIISRWLAGTTVRTRTDVYTELMTPTEQLMLAKRLLTIFLISKEAPTHSIADLLQVSPSTVARYQAEVQAGKWNATTTWLQRRRVEDTFLSVITDVLLLPVVDGGKPLSLGRFLDEKL